MADTEKQHYKCTKCGDTISVTEYSRNNYGRSGYAECSKGGKCNWKKQNQGWNNSLIGMIFNLIFWVFKLIFKGFKALFGLFSKKSKKE